ncbi:MAG: cell division protein FtsZ, partial [Hyphomicrobiaceae bacterium]
MSIQLQLPKVTELKPRITVMGVGGAGGNAVNNMIAAGLQGVEFIVANTDAQALAVASTERRIQLGQNLTEGLGAGSKPEIGEAAAEEAIEDIRAQIDGCHMLFLAAGMGGGTGTGATAVIARVAQEMGILTVAVVTKPFQFEGSRRLRVGEAGIAALKPYVDTLIVIPNQNLFRIANDRTTFAEAFVLADQVLYSGIACIVDLIVKEGLINLDLADVKTVLQGMGTAMMGTGEASGDRRAVVAAEEAISNPLLDDVTLRGAKGLLVSIIGGHDLTLYEVDEAATRVRQEVDPEANIIVGATFDESLGDRVRVSIVASGMQRNGQPAMPAAPGAGKGLAPGLGHDARAQGGTLGATLGATLGGASGQDYEWRQQLADALHPSTGATGRFDGPMGGAAKAPGSQTAARSAGPWQAPGGAVVEERGGDLLEQIAALRQG